jgi:ligand-binding sensor domain-containing protein/two-component sensor histidine kinase
VLPQFSGAIQYIAEDTVNDYYWLSTTKGIAVYDRKKGIYYTTEYNPLKFQVLSHPAFLFSPPDVYKDQNNILWLQTWEPPVGFVHYRYDINKNELVTIRDFGARFWGLITDASGITWAYGSLLARYDNKTNSFVTIPAKRNSQYGIDYNDVTYMSQDDEGNLWLATNLGLYYFNPGQQYFSTSNIVFNPMPGNTGDANINGFIEATDGHIIMLRWGGTGLAFFDTAFNIVAPLYGFNPFRVKGINHLLTWCGLQDSKGMIWIGCQHGRIIQLNPVTHQSNFIYPPEFADKTIRSITEDKKGNIWFGTQNNVIVKWDRAFNKFKQIVPATREKYNLAVVPRIITGVNSDIWAATQTGGLLHINCNTDAVVEQFLPDKNNSTSISSDNIKDIAELNADTLILATTAGLDVFDVKRKTFSHITEADGLPAEGIVSIIKDEKNNIWYSSVDGISRISLADRRIKNFGAADGITEQDFQQGSVARFKNGTIAFGNTRGYVSFDPADIKETGMPADVLITGFRIFNNRLSVDSLFQQGNTIRLKNSQNYFAIYFASLNNVMNNRPVYYYKLEGVDKDWITSTNQEAVYTYLPGGNYIFNVKCISPDGVESKNITSFNIHIDQPLYLQWWFILLALLLAGAIIYYIYLLRRRRKNERELIRNRIARDLHDDMGSTLSTINILSSMAKTKMTDDPRKTSEYISKISDSSQRMMEAMDDIVWSIRPDNDSMQKITARMREFATGILEAKDIELDFKVDEKVNDLKLNMEARRDFFLIFKEAVNNVAKYSHAEKCSIHISFHQHRLLLDVQDNGVGFDVNNADSGNGLSNMQKRAEALKGRMTVQSKPGEGTQVTLNMPVQ